MNNVRQIKTYKVVYPQVYSYVLPKREECEGSQKIGYTEKKEVEKRVLEQVKTPAFKEEYKILWSAPAFFKTSHKDFRDTDFHKFLLKSGVKKMDELGTEWFYFNGTPEKSKELFDTFVNNGFAALQNNNGKIKYKLRKEQEGAVQKTIKYFKENEKGEFLWNAKPRFGKTLAAYDLAKRLDAKTVLIVTNRPAIANSWFDDYETFIDEYAFISETSSLKDRPALSRNTYIDSGSKNPFFAFLSLQDLKGSKYFGGKYDKLKWIADLEWDLLVIDEAHEGIDTGRTDAAFDIINRKSTLHLSGTPFKALANEKFPKEAIFNWTYLDEQKAKQRELDEGLENGDHVDLPKIKLFTYRISQMVAEEVNKGVEIDDNLENYAFDLNEFFATKNKKFVREDEVKAFLKNLTHNEKYPFSTPELREQLKHTFWYVGNRVDSVKALAELLKDDPIFKDYKVIVAAGDGKTFEEEENDFEGNEKSYDKVKKAVKEYNKTITLSCGQLTTGVTIKEWSAVLMLTDIKSSSLYMQAAFRAQNPYKEYRDKKLLTKEAAYIFDFAPTRVLEIYDQFANGLNPKAVSGEITEKERKENIKELLNFFPVISEDTEGRMVELDAEKVLTFPNALAAFEIVNAKFMTNLLFNDNLKGVFHIPKEAEEIINKMSVEKNKRVEKAKTTLNLDEARKVNELKEKKINENKELILGEKIYKSNSERIIDDLLNEDKSINSPDEIAKKITNEAAKTLLKEYKEVYKLSDKEIKDKKDKLEEKIKEVAEEYNALESKDVSEFKTSLWEMIENDFVAKEVEEKEGEKVEQVRKTKEEEVKDRLRSFTRTIPMFIMANSSKDEITIDNFDEDISDEDFKELTNITKEEFHKLRDGFEYEEDGERKRFEGVFNKYRFNASIAEFRAKKEKMANYFTSKEDIFELIPNQKNNQIFTPRKIVKIMVDKLEKENPDLFKRNDTTFIDLYMKSGMYITEVVKKLFRNTRKMYNSDEECLKHILGNQVYGLAPSHILYDITQNYIFGFDSEQKISHKNFANYDLTEDSQNDRAKEKLEEIFNLKKDMKFDVVVGNPPYQESAERTESQTQGNSNYIYYHFQNIADKIGKNTCLIYPFGGWFDSPNRFGDFGKKILSDRHTISIDAYEGTTDRRAWYRTDKNPNPIFGRDANLSAGVAIVLRNLENEREAFFYSNRVYSDKRVEVKFEDWEYLTPNPDFMEWKKLLKGDKLKSRVKKGLFGIESNFVEKNPDKVSLNKSDWKDPIILLTNDKSGSAGRAVRFWTDRSTIEKGKEYIDLYKVVTTSAYPKKTFVSSEPTIKNIQKRVKEIVEILPKGSAFGASRLALFMSENKKEAENFVKYTQTRLFAFLLLQEPNQRSTIGSVILDQDFSDKSDIDWSKSVEEIDRQLYKKYGLSKEEIDFIENHE